MSSIDKRIVQMQFDNQGFEKGVSKTMDSLKSLNERLKMKNATNGLSDINSSMNKLSNLGISVLSSGVDSVALKFNALGVVATTALMKITSSAMDVGKKITSALTTDPIRDGFSEYETKMNAITTILTNTQSKGTTLDDVIKALGELNAYADKTIYNFAEMTKNIGTFTAAGVDLETSVTAIKGIANLAAGSGSSSQQASTAMYQLSQALSAGRVGLQDWNSVVNAGMGGEMFQNALKKNAKQMGIYVDESVPFRETLQDNWLTSEVLLKTLTQFAEDESLTKAATEVKTFTQLIDTMKESVGSGWATSWEHIIGNKEQAAELFTSISDGFNSIIGPSVDARNKLLEYWNTYGGRSAVIEGLTNVVKGFGKGLSAIGDAWKEVFPSMTGEQLVQLSHKFKVLSENFKMSDKTASKIKTTFKGLFDVLILAKDGVLAVIKGITPLGEIFEWVGMSILDAASSIGEFFSSLKKSSDAKGFFKGVADGVGEASSGIADFVLAVKDGIVEAFGYLERLDFSGLFKAIGGGFKGIATFLKPIIENVGNVIGTINFGTIFDIIQAGAAVEIVKQIKGMFGVLSDVGESATGFIDSFKGIGGSVKETLSTVKDTLVSYQKDLSASTLMKIAGAIAILSASLMLISSIDKEKMIGGLAGLTVVFAELTAAYIAMSKVGSFTGMFKLGSFMLSFATSIGILSLALKTLSEIEPEKLASGIIGLSSVMLIAVSASKMLSKTSGKFTSSATGLIIFSAALNLMVESVKKIGEIDSEKLGSGLFGIGVLLSELVIFMMGARFGGLGITSATGILILSAALLVLKDAVAGFGAMDPDTIIKGLIGISGILAEIALFSLLSGKGLNLIVLGVGMNIMAAGLSSMSKAMKSFGNMSWEEIGKGLTAIAGGLIVLGVATMGISGVKMTGVAIGIGVMGTALSLLGLALKSFGSMSWKEIGKGLTVLAGSLTILAVALYAMSGTIVGSAALVVAAGAMALLTPQLLILSQLDLKGVGIALLGMAGAFTVLGLAGLLLTPLIPGLLGLAGSIALIGAGAMACGVGLTLVGTGLAAVGAAAGASGFIIIEFFKNLLNLLPQLGIKAGEAIVSFATAIGDGSGQIIAAVTTIISGLITAIGTLVPQFVDMAVKIISAFVQGLIISVPEVVNGALTILLAVLQGIASNIGLIVAAGADCIINFLNGISSKLPEVIEAGINLAITFIEGIANGLSNNKERLATAITTLIKSIIEVVISLLEAAFPDMVEKGKEMIMGLIDGIEKKWPEVKTAAKEVINKAKEGLANIGTSLVNAGKDLINGFINGIGSMGSAVANKVKEIANGAINAAKSFLGIHSPSRVFIGIGKYTAEGMAVGLDRYAYMASNSAEDLASNVVDSVRNPLSNISRILNDDIDANPTITPVLDLSNVTKGTRLLNGMIGNKNMQINAQSRMLAGSVGGIQNKYDNSDIISALNGLKESLNNSGPSYTINGITYDDGSNVSAAVQTLVRAARIERRL